MRILQALLIDLLLHGYILGSVAWLLQHWELLSVPVALVPLSAVMLTAVAWLAGDSPGRHFLLGAVAGRWYRRWWGICLMLALALTMLVGWLVVRVRPVKFVMQFANAKHIVISLLSPNWKLLLPLLGKLAETIYLALLATVFAIPFAFGLSFFAARNIMPHNLPGNSVYVAVRTVATIGRSIEAIVWAIIFSVWVGIGPFAGMLALMVHSVAALTKLYSEQIENIDPGPVEAIRATGAGWLQVWFYGVVPQIFAPYLAFTIYRWDINVRMATIVGFVGGGGIGLALQQQQQMLAWRNVGMIMWLIAFTIWLMDMISGKMRARLLEIDS
ncbi:MAG: phosphonate ABC transporter, permease protein PhnE [Candidatus Cloacimonetes bacterium]|nr:phosphonate ABC transporter, permease protein PhnE [Candidatus Cloacimonadota bacterium]